jgi:hypothetical protein
MSRQLEEGNPYSSDKSKKVACPVLYVQLDGDGGKSRVGPKGRAAREGNQVPNPATSDSTNTFIYGTVTLSHLLAPSVDQMKAQKQKPRKVKCAVKTP